MHLISTQHSGFGAVVIINFLLVARPRGNSVMTFTIVLSFLT